MADGRGFSGNDGCEQRGVAPGAATLRWLHSSDMAARLGAFVIPVRDVDIVRKRVGA